MCMRKRVLNWCTRNMIYTSLLKIPVGSWSWTTPRPPWLIFSPRIKGFWNTRTCYLLNLQQQRRIKKKEKRIGLQLLALPCYELIGLNSKSDLGLNCLGHSLIQNLIKPHLLLQHGWGFLASCSAGTHLYYIIHARVVWNPTLSKW